MMKQISVDKKDADATREVVSKQEADAQTKVGQGGVECSNGYEPIL